jgi:hypothetical protein
VRVAKYRFVSFHRDHLSCGDHRRSIGMHTRYLFGGLLKAVTFSDPLPLVMNWYRGTAQLVTANDGRR